MGTAKKRGKQVVLSKRLRPKARRKLSRLQPGNVRNPAHDPRDYQTELKKVREALSLIQKEMEAVYKRVLRKFL